MPKKTSVLIITVWALCVLTILVINLGQEISLSLRVSGFYSRHLSLYYTAKAGINRVIAELLKDENEIDTLDETWANNEEFSKISLDDLGFATVSYEQDDQTLFGAEDEQSRININGASFYLLEALFNKVGLKEAKLLSANLLAWRGEPRSMLIPEESYDYSDLGYECKKDLFTSLEELVLVKGFQELKLEQLQSVKKFITIYGEGLININTVSLDVLEMLIESLAQQLNLTDIDAQEVAQTLVTFRDEVEFFTNPSQIISKSEEIFGFGQRSPQLSSLLNNLRVKISTTSNVFRITSGTSLGKEESTKSGPLITCIFDRKNKEFLYHHEI